MTYKPTKYKWERDGNGGHILRVSDDVWFLVYGHVNGYDCDIYLFDDMHPVETLCRDVSRLITAKHHAERFIDQFGKFIAKGVMCHEG